MVGSGAIAEDLKSILNSFDILLKVFKQLSLLFCILFFGKVCLQAAVDVRLFLPNSGHSLRAASGQANNLGDVHPADGGGAPLALIEAQEAALQRAPTTGHLWK